jgi:RNA polymerase sigma factor (TIGR02999 family)
MSEVTRILSAIEQGDPRAAEQLLPLVYDELRKLAAQKLASEKPGQTLQATALVHEAYLRLVGAQDPGWNGRNHFLAAAAEAMRRILVERSRRKRADKRGGAFRRVDLNEVDLPAVPGGAQAADLLALDEALNRFAAHDPVKAELVKLRYFVGLSIEEAAGVLGISRATAARHWDYARSWLYSELRGRGPERDSPKKSPRP